MAERVSPFTSRIPVALQVDEVPQVYLDAPEMKPQGVQFAPKTLVAFDRLTLQPGEEREVTLEVAPRAFSVLVS